MKKTFVLTLGATLLLSAYLSPTIYEITEIEAIASFIKNALAKEPGPCAVVAFDIDNTILRGVNPAATDEWFGEKLKEYTTMGLSSDQAVEKILPEHLQAHRTTKVEAIDDDVETLIDALKHKNIHVIALTARALDFVDITIRQLHDVKIDLTPHKPFDDPWQRCYELSGLPKMAYYIPGIILACGNDKGMVFEHFLRQLKYRPHLIVFVDDTRKNIDAVERMCKRLGIKSACCLITKAKLGIAPTSGTRFKEKSLIA